MSKYLPNVGEYVSRNVVIGFTDDYDEVAIPSSVQWRVVCPDNDQVISDWATATAVTSVGPDGYSDICEATISVVASSHAMVTDSLPKERRALIVVANKDADDEWNEEFLYYVERRAGRS